MQTGWANPGTEAWRTPDRPWNKRCLVTRASTEADKEPLGLRLSLARCHHCHGQCLADLFAEYGQRLVGGVTDPRPAGLPTTAIGCLAHLDLGQKLPSVLIRRMLPSHRPAAHC